MFLCCDCALSGTQKGRTGGPRGGKKMGDKPNYLLRIQKKCVINCGDPEESWRFRKPVGLRVGGQVGSAVYHL